MEGERGGEREREREREREKHPLFPKPMKIQKAAHTIQRSSLID